MKVTRELFESTGIDYQSTKAIQWFNKECKKMSFGEAHASQTINEFVSPGKITSGDMLLLQYSAKYADTLPYWDIYPIMILLSMDNKHFWGLNLHYLTSQQRQKVMIVLYAQKMGYGLKSFKPKWQMMKSAIGVNLAKKCIKQYIIGNIEKLSIISKDSWSYVAFMPLAKWKY